MVVFTSELEKAWKIGREWTLYDRRVSARKSGQGGAFVRTRLKSFITGNVLERTYRSGEKLEVPEMEEKQMQFLYKEGTDYHFMNEVTYEQFVSLMKKISAMQRTTSRKAWLPLSFFTRGELWEWTYRILSSFLLFRPNRE